MNPRPLGYEPNELPDCSTPRQTGTLPNHLRLKFQNLRSEISVVGLGRVELPTSRLSGVRSNQLSYRPLGFFLRFNAETAPFLTQKRATLLFRGPFITVDALEGRVASVAKYCLRSTLLPNCKRSIIDFRSEISNLRLEIPDRIQSLNTR